MFPAPLVFSVIVSLSLLYTLLIGKKFRPQDWNQFFSFILLLLLLLLLLFLRATFGFMTKVCFHPLKLMQFSMNGHAIKCSTLVKKKGNWKTNFLYTLFFAGFLALNIQLAAGMTGDGVIVTKADYKALRAFKSELIDFKGFLRSWNDSGFGACSGGWVGIKCVNGQVIAIQLPWKGLGGRISERIGSLQELRKLSLHDNLLSGTVPSSLGFLPKLRGVYLFNNRLSGSIPPSIGRSSVFQTLDLSNNSLSGGIPPALTNSTRLYRLNLSYNSLSGLIPTSITLSPSLTILALNHNNLSGQIPDSWGGSGNGRYHLKFLTLDHNHLSGSIPISLSKLSWIEEISLSHNELSGSLPRELGRLTRLRLLDLSTNTINGTFPDSFFNLSSIVSLNLESNRFKDHIPDSFVRLKNLSTINLKNNQFYGEIPAIIGNISLINQLDFSQNNLTGEIPASLGSLANLTFFNVSYNNLSGPVPLALSNKFNSSSFTGNLQLCGYSPSLPCPSIPQNLPAPPPEASRKHSRKLSTKDIILIATGALIVFLLLFCGILVCCLVGTKKNGKISKPATSRSSEKSIPGGAEIGSGHAGGKLVHFDGPFVFTADDLLCATAEIMGKSTYGTTYKATLEDENVVAVKRLREKTTKGEKEFEHEVAEIGKIRHPNLLSIRAYYLGPKGEKLLVYDYMANGSLASFLHARGPESLIDWATRMKIVVGITRGLCYLHTEEINIIHGNLTSSNILLDEKTNAHIADFGLSRLMTSTANTNVIATAGTQGYNAPELFKTKKTTSKTDIYSLGVIILELLTGKSPGETMNGMDLTQWVASTVKGDRTNELFDLELMRDTQTIGDELLSTLKLALHCVDPSPDARPDVQQVLQQLEEIKPEIASVSAQDDAPIPSSNA